MKFREQLVKLRACKESLEWIGNRTIEEAWKTCENSNWMLWFLSKTDLDLIDPICDMAERVLDLAPEESQLACIWSISAARRRANQDELTAAGDAAYGADADYDTIPDGSYFACYSASYAAAYAYAADDRRSLSKAKSKKKSNDAVWAAYSAASCTADYASRATADYMNESKNQCDILRKYFTIDQVLAAFNKLVV